VRVFISWSGDLSRAIAVELREWLPMVVHQVDAWISGRDILFEAGAVARSLEARVVPLLFGISLRELDGPLAQFQSLQGDKKGIRQLVSTLYESSKSGLDTHQRDEVFARLWPIFEERLQVLTALAPQTRPIESPIDLVSDLALSERPPAARAVEKDIFGRLEAERERLGQQLDYLNAEDEKLTQQDAPISLQHAIEPIKQRLGSIGQARAIERNPSISCLA
jgi:hypothetical protein